MTAIDAIIDDYANQLQNIYTERTAAGHTFAGLLAEFAGQIHEDAARQIRDQMPESGRGINVNSYRAGLVDGMARASGVVRGGS